MTGYVDTVVARGAFRHAVYPTTGRPSATACGAGTEYFDTTLNRPLWSDGVNWLTADGAIG